MAKNPVSENDSHNVETIHEQVAQLRTDLQALGHTLIEWGQYQGSAARNGLQSGAQALGVALSTTLGAVRNGGTITLLNLCKAQAAVVLVVLILMGCTAMTGRQSVSEAYDDTAITAKVKSSLIADPVVSAAAIDVDTLTGSVSLNGIVTSEQERQRAIQLARSTQGVRQVDARNLMVKRS